MSQEEDMLDKKVWAVAGASTNTKKYGYKLYKHLKSKGYRVYPVNPNCEEIDGDTCYKDLSSLPEIPDVVDMVVPPNVGKVIIEEAAQLGIKNAWFQPGSYDDELLKRAEELGIQTVQACVLMSAK